MKVPSIGSLQAFFSRLSKKERSILYVASAIVFLMVMDRLVVGPIFSKMAELSREIEDKEAGIKRSMHMLAHKDRILAAAVRYKTFIHSSRSEEEEMTALLKEIETLASDHSIYLIDMKPGGLQDVAGTKKYLLNLNCEAQLEQLISFMYDVEISQKLLTIVKYKIGPKAKDSSVARCSMSISKVVIP
jgi:nitrate/nitrite-specific signal transduction histidine kinase